MKWRTTTKNQKVTKVRVKTYSIVYSAFRTLIYSWNAQTLISFCYFADCSHLNSHKTSFNLVMGLENVLVVRVEIDMLAIK